MAQNPFIGRDRSWLEAKLREAQDELASGKSSISGGMADVSFGKIMTVGPQKRIDQLYWALNRIDPATYPIDQIASATRTTAIYRGPR